MNKWFRKTWLIRASLEWLLIAGLENIERLATVISMHLQRSYQKWLHIPFSSQTDNINCRHNVRENHTRENTWSWLKSKETVTHRKHPYSMFVLSARSHILKIRPFPHCIGLVTPVWFACSLCRWTFNKRSTWKILCKEQGANPGPARAASYRKRWDSQITS